MSGDLEDFLRRAAQRRRDKEAQQRGATGQPAGSRSTNKTRPQYSNSRSERIVSAEEADEVLEAELVEDELHDSIAARMRRLEAARRAAAETHSHLGSLSHDEDQQKAKTTVGGGKFLTGDPAQDLIRLLREPRGIQQAILLKEILDRPEHRW
ncbi:MAG: hypothetical protein JJ992_08970 [Planctomycetes bacterium]|nr:hypothetical protein [Planctomycetota bacterium]